MRLLSAAVAVAVGAVAQSVSGIGFSLVAGPLLVLAFGAGDGVRVSLGLSLLMNVGILAREFRRVLWWPLLPILTTAVLATPVAADLIGDVQPRALRIAAGAATLAGAGVVAAGFRPLATLPRAVAAGALSAVMNVLAAASGPAVAVYASAARWEPSSARATLQAYFLVLNVVSILALGLPRASGPEVTILVCAWAAGSLLGARLAVRVDPGTCRRLALGVAMASGAVVMVAAIAA